VHGFRQCGQDISLDFLLLLLGLFVSSIPSPVVPLLLCCPSVLKAINLVLLLHLILRHRGKVFRTLLTRSDLSVGPVGWTARLHAMPVMMRFFFFTSAQVKLYDQQGPSDPAFSHHAARLTL